MSSTSNSPVKGSASTSCIPLPSGMDLPSLLAAVVTAITTANNNAKDKNTENTADKTIDYLRPPIKEASDREWKNNSYRMRYESNSVLLEKLERFQENFVPENAEDLGEEGLSLWNSIVSDVLTDSERQIASDSSRFGDRIWGSDCKKPRMSDPAEQKKLEDALKLLKEEKRKNGSGKEAGPTAEPAPPRTLSATPARETRTLRQGLPEIQKVRMFRAVS